MLTAGLTAVAELPALSVTVAVAVRPLPSPVMVDGPGQATTPDRLSAQVQVMVTSPRYQPAALAAGAAWPTMVGAVLSTLIAATVAEAALPAASVAVPVTGWFLPSVATVVGAVHEATPDTASAQVKVTVTLPLFQPLVLAAGAWVWLMVGAVLSMLTWMVLAVSVLPALSTLQNL